MLRLLKTVAAKLSGRKLILTPVRQAYELEALVAGIVPENQHGETDWGRPIDKETGFGKPKN